jgi:hypothetical protein
VVEQVLSGDPAGAYAEMDFATRDRYRHSIEELSRRSQSPELVVATRAIDMAREAMERDPANDRRHHVGYYLISRGRFALEEALRYRPRVRERLARFVFEHPAIGYLGTLGMATALGVSGLLAYAARHGTSTSGLWIVGLLVLPAGQRAGHRAVTCAADGRSSAPGQLPKLALKNRHPRAGANRWSSCRQSSISSRGSRALPRSWKCGFSPTATATSTSRC